MNAPKPSFRRNLLSSWKLLFLLIPISLTLNSCTSRDLKAARALGEMSEQLDTLNTSVSADIYDSCARSVTWLNRDISVTGQNIRDGLKICDELYRPNADRTQLAGELLVEYVGAIATLADSTDQKDTLETQFRSIGESLSKFEVPAGDDITVQLLPQNTIDTGVDIATFLANLLLSDFRRRKIKLAVVCTDPDIQSYSADFSSFIEELYGQEQLNDEIDSITRFYQQTNLLSDVITQPLAAADVAGIQDTQDRRSAELRAELLKVTARKNDAATYVTVIREMAIAHSKLKLIFNDGQDALSAEQTAKCDRYFAPDRDRAKTANLAEPKGLDNPETVLEDEISLSELEQVRTVVDDYLNRVQPLLKDIRVRDIP
jgi:hypothetical protein